MKNRIWIAFLILFVSLTNCSNDKSGGGSSIGSPIVTIDLRSNGNFSASVSDIRLCLTKVQFLFGGVEEWSFKFPTTKVTFPSKGGLMVEKVIVREGSYDEVKLVAQICSESEPFSLGFENRFGSQFYNETLTFSYEPPNGSLAINSETETLYFGTSNTLNHWAKISDPTTMSPYPSVLDTVSEEVETVDIKF